MKDLTGLTFGRLTVVKLVRSHGENHYWLCRCSCGKESTPTGASLRRGNTKSCGCLHREIISEYSKKHGMHSSKIYKRWGAMKSRCNNPNARYYRNYGLRGIKVCDRWQYSFENFYADMGDPPTPKHTLDRINNNGNYEPSNCRWATRGEQQSNMRRNVLISYKGRTMTASQWSRDLNITLATIYGRVKRGLNPAKILSKKRLPNSQKTIPHGK